jgi:nucleotidyltransferase substrate binding protein (TIGR01987 family)
MDKLDSAEKALAKLEAILLDPVRDEKTRDASIQRFEFTSEICWKLLQEVLKDDYMLEIRYPKGCYEAAFQVGLLDETLCLSLNRTIKDRNLTSHTYHEGLAQQIFENLPEHAKAFRLLLESIKAR